MAVRKRAKTKTKLAKKSAKPRVKKKALRAKAAPKKAKARAPKKSRTVARPAPLKKPPAALTPRPQAPLSMPGAPPAPPAIVVDGERVGIVTHYYSHLSVAIVLMERGSLRAGDRVHIKGHTTDFQQRVESMEIDHVHVAQVGAKQEFGMRVTDHVREHDVVYKLAST
jgi:putative protease